MALPGGAFRSRPRPVQPTIFADTSDDGRLAREEGVRPVLVAIPWRDEEEAPRSTR